MFKVTRRRILVVVIILLLLGGIGYSRARSSNGKEQVITASVNRKTIVENITSSGKTQAKESVDLHFLTSGRLAWIGVKEGDTVEVGQVIASLDRQELQKNLEKALRDYSKERNDFEEDKNVVYKNQIVSDTIKRILEKNQWDLEKAVLDVELKSIALQWSTITTPIAGTVTHLDQSVAGVNISVADTFSIANLSSLVFTATVDELAIGKVSVGQTAQIELDAYPDKFFTGTVTKIAYSAETSSGGATVFPVEITFSDPEVIRIGLNGDVAIKYKEVKDALIIPIDSVKEDESGKYVFIKIQEKYQKQDITTGLKNEDEIEIVSGLDETMLVVTDGFQYLPEEVQ